MRLSSFRNPRIEVADRWRRITQNCRHRFQIGDAGERAAAGGHLVKHDAEREEVGSSIDDVALRLLGRHVRDGAKNVTRSGQCVRADTDGLVEIGYGSHLPQTEIKDRDSAAGVCGGHRLAYAHAYVQQALDRKRVTMSATRGCCVASKGTTLRPGENRRRGYI